MDEYVITIEGHSLYRAIGQGLRTPNKPLAILTVEALARTDQFRDSLIHVWQLDQGMGNLNHWQCIASYDKGRWHNTVWS